MPSTITRNTYGSSLIRIGETRVLAGTTLQVGKPSSSYPNRGDISINLDMGPICSPKYNQMNRIQPLDYQWNGTLFQQSLDKQKAIESWLMRTLIHPSRHHSGNGTKCSNHGEMLDLEQLIIEPHKSAWHVIVSVIVLNYDGNIEDAALMAAVTALLDTVLPPTKVVTDGNGNDVVALLDEPGSNDFINSGKRLKLNFVPIPLTIGLFQYQVDNDGEDEGGKNQTDLVYKMLVDPTGEEESILSGIMSIVIGLHCVDDGKGDYTVEIGKKSHILSINKPGGDVIVKSKDIAACMQLCRGRAIELAPILKQIMNGHNIKEIIEKE